MECGLCAAPLPKGEPEKIFRLSRKQGKKLSKESLLIQRWVGKSSLCESCAANCRRAGLRTVSQAQIRAWGQKKAAVCVLDMISQSQAEALKRLKAELEAEAAKAAK